MDTFVVVLWVSVGVVVLAGVVALIVVASRRAAERTREHQAGMLAWAAQNGLTYAPSDPSLVTAWKGEPFIGGRTARALDVVTGHTARGRFFCSFVYEYVVSTGKSSTTIREAVLVVRLPAVLPDLLVTPEGLGDRIAKRFGGQDITCGSDAFDKAYRVRAADEDYARALLGPVVTDWLLGPGQPLAPWRVAGPDLLSWRRMELAPEQILSGVALIDALIDQLPRDMWGRYGRPDTRPVA